MLFVPIASLNLCFVCNFRIGREHHSPETHPADCVQWTIATAAATNISTASTAAAAGRILCAAVSGSVGNIPGGAVGGVRAAAVRLRGHSLHPLRGHRSRAGAVRSVRREARRPAHCDRRSANILLTARSAAHQVSSYILFECLVNL